MELGGFDLALNLVEILNCHVVCGCDHLRLELLKLYVCCFLSLSCLALAFVREVLLLFLSDHLSLAASVLCHTSYKKQSPLLVHHFGALAIASVYDILTLELFLVDFNCRN